MMGTNYAPASHWDERFRALQQKGDDLDWGTWWTGTFLKTLQKAAARDVLDLGCGSGNDVNRLAHAGLQPIGFDYSKVAIAQAMRKAQGAAQFLVGDMAQDLPFANGVFDAVMSNVAAHMFSDAVTRSLFQEVHRIVKADGLFLFHVNAVEDRSLRALRWPPLRELEPNYILEAHGQTMRFFSGSYLRELLRDWADVQLVLVEIPDWQTGQPFKRVWRGIARK